MEVSDVNRIKLGITHKLVRAFLDIIILKTLQNGKSSGYGIIKKVYEKFDVLLSASAVYSVLNSLNDKQFVSIVHDGCRKTFSLTKDGCVYADAVVEEYEKLTSQIISLANS